MSMNLNTQLSLDELDIVSGGKGRVTVSEGDTYDIAGKGLLTIGTTTLPSGQKVAFAQWEPGEKL